MICNPTLVHAQIARKLRADAQKTPTSLHTLHRVHVSTSIRSIYFAVKLETKQPAPPLAKRIDDNGTQKQTYGDSDCHLNHAEPDVEDDRALVLSAAKCDLCARKMSAMVRMKYTQRVKKLFPHSHDAQYRIGGYKRVSRE
jgi:hypothetical protein